jgi:hypothetical protein
MSRELKYERRAVATSLFAACGGGERGGSEDPSRSGKGRPPLATPLLPDLATALSMNAYSDLPFLSVLLREPLDMDRSIHYTLGRWNAPSKDNSCYDASLQVQSEGGNYLCFAIQYLVPSRSA